MKLFESLTTLKKVRPTHPQFFYLSKKIDKTKLAALLKRGEIRYVVDDFIEQCRELYAIEHPEIALTPEFEKMFQKQQREQNKHLHPFFQGVWVFYPWLSTIVHLLEEEKFFLVRTARNKYLINEQEQSSFYNSCIGIGGLSVGSSIILTIVLEGGARHVKLADMDKLALSNTNRIRTNMADLGSFKVNMVARQIYEINPFTKIDILKEGLNEQTLEKFFTNPRPDIVIDEIDNLAIKYRIREWAKKTRVPVVMAADNGEMGVVDIERYDLSSKTKFFHGRMGKINYKKLLNLDKLGTGKMITKHIGPEHLDLRMQHSLLEMGKTIVSWPQLGGTAMLNGAAVAYVIRRILNHQEVENNRGIISLDENLSPHYGSKVQIAKRKKAEKFFRNLFDS